MKFCTWWMCVCHYFIERAFAIGEFIATATSLHGTESALKR